MPSQPLRKSTNKKAKNKNAKNKNAQRITYGGVLQLGFKTLNIKEFFCNYRAFSTDHISSSFIRWGWCGDPAEACLGPQSPLGSYLELGHSRDLALTPPRPAFCLAEPARCLIARAGMGCSAWQSGRFHRSQVFGEPSRNPAVDTSSAMSPLNGGGLPSRRPRSHGGTAPLDGRLGGRDASRRTAGGYRFWKRNFQTLFFTWSAGKQREIGVQHHSVDNKPLSNDIFTGRPQRSPMPTLLWGRW